ncbi:hypothetical protein CP967_04205 [Streptomyces nitrosporeus]|uniref:Uncharacterized protein n=1 Tax=Streptomyces nitrosporeus TaxID=28894 RepID=A0A5J6F699_9ACTN|nr:hypothetical protein CP967_04205 [Streptomyces nitrosporeus]
MLRGQLADGAGPRVVRARTTAVAARQVVGGRDRMSSPSLPFLRDGEGTQPGVPDHRAAGGRHRAHI